LKEYSHHFTLLLLPQASAKPLGNHPELSREEPEAPPESTESGQLIVHPDNKMNTRNCLKLFRVAAPSE